MTYTQLFFLSIFFHLTFLKGEGSGRGHKRRKGGEESESSGEEGSDEERPKKRGRPSRREIKGFNDAEVRPWQFKNAHLSFHFQKNYFHIVLYCRFVGL